MSAISEADKLIQEFPSLTAKDKKMRLERLLYRDIKELDKAERQNVYNKLEEAGIVRSSINVCQLKGREKPDAGENHIKVEEYILSERRIIYAGNKLYEYTDGVYSFLAPERLHGYIKELVGERFTKKFADEVKFAIQTDTYVEPDKLNDTPLLNLKNGLFDLETYELKPHSPEVLSTIQLNVSYNPNAEPRKFIQFMDEICEGVTEKIDIIQEFFGYCFQRRSNLDKALILIGVGANGKSVLLYVLEILLGEDNISAVPFEKFNNHFYLANLYGKVANISIEANAKAQVYDSTFKAVVTGDSIEVDRKFEKPFSFRPFCKLIFALNNMPRVSDTTDSYFRRLIIISLNRVFQESEQNKNLKYELVEELDGIFLWCLEGLKNLRERGGFRITEDMLAEVAEYRKDNNSVLLFIEEECRLDSDATTVKATLYSRYVEWCERNHNRPVAQRRFGRELKDRYRTITETRTPDRMRSWIWAGICLNTDIRT
ncbi:MAG: phage/plasmid primase, P4 family [Candidatus Omnitrophota bacterium]